VSGHALLGMTLGVLAKGGSRTSHLPRDSLRFDHHSLTRIRGLHGRAGGYDHPVWLLAAKDRVETHLAGG
jgi:hypothetical protein